MILIWFWIKFKCSRLQPYLFIIDLTDMVNNIIISSISYKAHLYNCSTWLDLDWFHPQTKIKNTVVRIIEQN